MIFVFGSNLAGRHGKGAALTARKRYGAIYGQAYGLQGQSFAIPTKDERLHTLKLYRIQEYVDRFITFAVGMPKLQFNVTAVGCGHAGYVASQMAPLFKDCIGLGNVHLCDAFHSILVPSPKGIFDAV